MFIHQLSYFLVKAFTSRADVLSICYCHQVQVGLLRQVFILLLWLYLRRLCSLVRRLFLGRLVDFPVFLSWLRLLCLCHDRLLYSFRRNCRLCSLSAVLQLRHYFCYDRRLLIWFLLPYIKHDEQEHAGCDSNAASPYPPPKEGRTSEWQRGRFPSPRRGVDYRRALLRGEASHHPLLHVVGHLHACGPVILPLQGLAEKVLRFAQAQAVVVIHGSCVLR